MTDVVVTTKAEWIAWARQAIQRLGIDQIQSISSPDLQVIIIVDRDGHVHRCTQMRSNHEQSRAEGRPNTTMEQV